MKELMEEYSKLQKKYNLPSFKELDKEFEIRAIELNRSGLLIKAILRGINNKLNLFMGYLEPIVNGQPQNIHALIELRHTTPETKRKMFEYYKEISALLHENIMIELKTEKEIADQIKKLWKQWPNLKKQEIIFLETMVQAWRKKEEESKFKTEYAG